MGNEHSSDRNKGKTSNNPKKNGRTSDPPPKNGSTSSNPPPNTENPSSDPPQNSRPSPPIHEPEKKLGDRWYSRIGDHYNSLYEVIEALKLAGLESSNLIVGIDFTKSNEWTGEKSYGGQSLHHTGNGQNPYEQAISIIGKTLAAFDEDNLIPCYGFGDASTHDQDIFSLSHNGAPCNGFEEVLSQYRGIIPHLKLAGPTSFAPIIEMAMTIVEQSGGQYHVLLIIADGQVTGSEDTEEGKLSPQERKTVHALVEASKFPLSIILVGVGDGPWDMMKEYDDYIPARDFDNFQFVNFTEIMSKDVDPSKKEAKFALSALMEIPSQYKATMELNLLGERKGYHPERMIKFICDHLAMQFLLLQALVMNTRFVQFALLTQRTWLLVVVIRHAVSAAESFQYAQFVAVMLRSELSSIKLRVELLVLKGSAHYFGCVFSFIVFVSN